VSVRRAVPSAGAFGFVLVFSLRAVEVGPVHREVEQRNREQEQIGQHPQLLGAMAFRPEQEGCDTREQAGDEPQWEA
jgi:hypothetical protein